MSEDHARAHHGIDYVELYVTEMERAQRFYNEAFGWEFTDYAPAYAGIKRDGGGEWGGLALVDEIKTGGPLVILYSRALQESAASVVRAGGEITKKVFEFPGGRRFEFRDPFGNALAVWTPDEG